MNTSLYVDGIPGAFPTKYMVYYCTAVLLLLATATKAQSVIRALFGRFITLRDSDRPRFTLYACKM